jgi:flagellum-specific peptidoglycan hydrolase FlgJ
MTPEEIQAVFEEYANAQKTGATVSAELTARMKDATAGIKGYSAQLNASLKALGSSVLGVAKAMKDGEQGASVYNDSINSAADAIDSFASKFGFLGKLIGTLITAGARYAVEVNKQSDKLFDAYKNLSSSGLADAGGMTTIFSNMQKFGYGIEQLGDMAALLKANSTALAAFGGTAASGTKAFADAATEIQRSEVGKSLQMLGKTPDDINKGMALFVKQQQQSGISSANINKNLADQSAAYIKNLDLLSKLTGDDAARLQEKLDAAMAEDAFNQTVYELKKKAAAGDAEAGRLATEYENAARRLTGEALKEFQQGVGSDISAMGKTLMASSEAVGMIGKASFTASGYIDALATGVTRQRDAMGGLFKLNAGKDFMFGAKEMSEIQSRYADTTAKSQEDMAKAQQELQKKGLDPATKAQIEMRIEQMKTRDEFQSLINKGINPVTKGMSKLAGGIESVTDKIPGTGTSTGTKMGGGETGSNWWNPFSGGGKTTTPKSSKEFMDSMYNTLLDEAKKQGLKNPEVIAKLGTAQSALETGYGKSLAGGNNYFGIKARPGEGGSGVATQEFINGKMVTVNDKFRKYNSMQESAADYIKFLQENKRYKDVLAAGTLQEAISAQSKTGYATDPNYGNKLAGIAGNISGPNSKYESTTTDIQPDKTLPTATANAAPPDQSNSMSDYSQSFDRMVAHMEDINRKMSDLNDNTRAVKQNTAVL